MWLEGLQRQRDIYSDVFAGRRNYIPLCLSLKSLVSINRWEYYGDWQQMLDNELAKAEAVRAIGSDQIPTVVLRFDPVPLLSMFGATVIQVGGRPFAAPIFRTPEQAARLEAPSLDAGILSEIEKAIEWFRRRTPAGMVLVTPPETDPVDVLLLLFGSDVFLWMAERPDAVTHALNVITDAFIRVQQRWKALLGEPQFEKVTYLGNSIPGVRVAADALVNLSPAMIRQFCYPAFERIAEACGKVLVHYCPSPEQKYYHVMRPVLECPWTLGVDTSGGVDYFDAPANATRLLERGVLLADCAFHSKPEAGVVENASTNINRFHERSWDEMDEWLDTDFMRLARSGGRPLVLRAAVSSIAEGRELYQHWRAKFDY